MKTAMSETVIDTVQMIFDCPPVTEHSLGCRAETIGSRMASYSLDDPLVAVESLVREVVFGWAVDLTPVDPADPLQTDGGTDERIAVSWTDEALAQANAVLTLLADRINAARDHFLPSAPPTEIEAS